jgi:hypothetical protein
MSVGSPYPTKPPTIIVNAVGPIRYKEGIAGGTIKPGHLITESVAASAPLPPTVVVHASQGVHAVLQIAIEDSLIGNGIDTNYASGSPVRSFVPKPGDIFQGWLKDGETASYGSRLVSKGDGSFEVAASTEVGLCIAREASSPSGSDSMIYMEAV